MVDPGPDFGRAYASQVLLDPEILGTDNVQDALDTIGGAAVILGDSADGAVADTQTTVAMNGSSHAVDLITASPPAWMDNAGHIIAAGVYAYRVEISAGAAATTPGQFVLVFGAFVASAFIPVDPLGSLDNGAVEGVVAIGAADLPYAVTVHVEGQTDATATINARPSVQRLVAPAS